MSALRFIVVATLMGLCLADTKKRYDGYKVIRVTPSSVAQMQSVRSLQDSIQGEIEFWTDPAHADRPVDIMVGPAELDNVCNTLQDLGLSFSTLIEDVQQRADSITVDQSGGVFSLASFNYDTFHSYADINSWVSSMAASHSAIVREDKLADKSYEGRDIKLLKIGKPGVNKKIIFWQSGTHSREWLSPATQLKIVSWLVREYEIGQADIVQLLDKVDIYAMPLFNPDGYFHSHEFDRMWRKTRSVNKNSNCRGVDPNRNFNAGWDVDGGASTNPCAQDYRGPSVQSEIEVRSLTNYISALTNVQVYIDMHCYSQLWMFPFGYKYDYAGNYWDQFNLATDAMKALYAKHYKTFDVGPIAHVIYKASGSSVDWAHEMAGIPYAYAPELRDKGVYGFIAPPSEINPSAQEVYEAIKVIGNKFV
ncbi:carboxypeptidase B-like [Asterias rubens]|uniref:carboxypeptidase B-like n=1 Tax=Asterias rubens TaxID=7604 RepID=UPI001454FA98|nr:carboxypeptidase B-like [Asterias rubens]